MASNTENLGLLKKNPSTDGADTFNIQTMLNDNWDKLDANAGTVAQTLANILKPTTPPLIGLPPSTTPDGMFRALGNTGELHVWRKTVVNSQAVAASYTLGEKANISLASQSVSDGSGSVTKVTVLVANSISVSDSGAIIPGTTTEYYTYPGSISAGTLTDSVIAGKFIFVSTVGSNVQLEDVALRDIYYAPSDATLSSHTGSPRRYLIASNLQKVIGHPYQPAETTTTYPVSTNPNAYQEGDDAKAAGYTLGKVVTGSFAITSKSSPGGVGTRWNDSSALSVSDDGTCTLATTGGTYIDGTTTNAATTAKNELQGKFAYCNNTDTDFTSSVIVFFPSNTIFTRVGNIVYADRYQPVTGYAAIPAGTTIEYLGKLGDKARVQVVSYVGTGTYGKNNPCSLTFDFAPKVVMFLRGYKESSTQFNYLYGSYGSDSLVIISADLSNIFAVYNGFGRYNSAYAKKDLSGRTITWYSNENSNSQANASGVTHYFLAIG